jgi:hypothetical protein
MKFLIYGQGSHCKIFTEDRALGFQLVLLPCPAADNSFSTHQRNWEKWLFEKLGKSAEHL